jgi:hypothetical protein
MVLRVRGENMSDFRVGDKVVAPKPCYWWFTPGQVYEVVVVHRGEPRVIDDEGDIAVLSGATLFAPAVPAADPTREKVLKHIREHLMTPIRTAFYSGYEAALTDLLAGVFSLKFVTKTVTTSEFEPI